MRVMPPKRFQPQRLFRRAAASARKETLLALLTELFTELKFNSTNAKRNWTMPLVTTPATPHEYAYEFIRKQWERKLNGHSS